MLSHEPILSDCWFNIHGHDHSWKVFDSYNSMNLVANVVDYEVCNLGLEIKRGLLSKVNSIHRVTIDKASRRAK